MENKVKLEIPRFIKKKMNNSTLVFFEFIISKDSETWKLEKRFSECHMLHEDLKKSHGNTLPPFPSKSLFSLKTYEQLTPRRQKLEFYFQQIIKRMDLIRDTNTLSFLKMELGPEDGFVNVVKIVSKIASSFGVRDFSFDIGNYKYLFMYVDSEQLVITP